jgi:large subunit ribosomal protein L25
MFVIAAKKRNSDLKRGAMKKEGEIPAVFYGMGKDTTSISVKTIDFKKVWRQAGESSAVKVSLSDGAEIDALIHEVQTDPVTDEPIHADFLAIDMNKKIKVKVPLEFAGVSEAVKNGTGNLVKVLHEIEIEALPKDLPHNLAVDVSKLATLADTVIVSDIKLPSGVEAVTGLTDVVASIVAQVEEKEEVAAPVDLSTIEVEKKGKKEEEGAEGEVAAAPEPAEKVEKKDKK